VTTTPDVGAPAPTPVPLSAGSDARPDHRGSWVPTGAMVTTRLLELRKRRGLMIALVAVNIGLPTVFLTVRLLAHAFAPRSYGPAGGYDIYTNLVAGVMYVFGFIVAATLGCTAGSVDLTEGMFRHLVVTGRSRLALYLARIPAGLAIVVPLVAVGFSIVCAVCVFAAPTSINYDGAHIPAGLSRAEFEAWAGDHVKVVFCDFPYNAPTPASIACGNGPTGPNGGTIIVKGPPGSAVPGRATPSVLRAQAVVIARQDYSDYRTIFLAPSDSLMIRSGLWLELEATIGFVVGLGLASLLGQRTISVILMIVLELVLTPIAARAHIPHLVNAQRSIVGLATAHLEPAGLPVAFGGGGGGGPGGAARSLLVPETRIVAVCVIVAWLVGWSALGAWRMTTRDA
jgi:hypothetical protein